MRSNLYDLLGVDRHVTDRELKVAYRERAKKLHPDSNPSVSESENARLSELMGEISAAYEILSNPSSRREYDRALDTDSDFVYSENGSRTPNDYECAMCAHVPTHLAKLRQHQGFLLFMRTQTFELRACRGCGLFFSREVQNRTLYQGWWGAFSVIINLVVIASNAREILAFERLSDPIPPRDNVARPMSEPSWQGKSIFKRVGVYVPVVLLALLLVSKGSDYRLDYQGSNSFTTYPTTPTTRAPHQWQAGMCFNMIDNFISSMTSCSDIHEGEVLAVVDFESNCPSAYNKVFTEDASDADPGKIVCLEVF